MKQKANIKVEQNSLENLILLGKDKLINIELEYPTENGKIEASAKIKQLTMRELQNLDVANPNLRTNIEILKKALFQQDGTEFTEDLILSLPIGVVNAIAEKILEISGVNEDLKKY